MDAFNSVCTNTADVLLAPFAAYPLVGLVFWGVVAGALMAFVVGRTSNQTALARVVDRTRAQLLAVGLFRDDLGVTFRCQLELLKLICLRLWYSIPPMLVMIVPFFVVLSQLALRYETQPLRPGDRATVYLYLAEPHWKAYHDTILTTSLGVTIETEGLRDDLSKSIAWRIRADDGQASELTWQMGDNTIKKTLAATTIPGRLSVVSQVRTAGSIWTRALHPAEKSLVRDGAVRYIQVVYPHARSTPVLGWKIPWWASFLGVSMVTAYLAGALIGVKF